LVAALSHLKHCSFRNFVNKPFLKCKHKYLGSLKGRRDQKARVYKTRNLAKGDVVSSDNHGFSKIIDVENNG
jgi:hypothetical protein